MTAFDRPTLDQIAGQQPAWRAEQMADAFVSFQTQDVPAGSQEEWKYVDLEFDLASLAPATTPGSVMAPGPFMSAATRQVGAQITIVDGSVVGVVDDDGDALIQRLADLEALQPAASVDKDKFAAGHLAFATDGVRVTVPNGKMLERPLLIDVQATQGEVVSFPHVEVELGENAEGSVLLVYRSPDDVPAVVVPGVTLNAGDGARLRFMSVQGWGSATSGLVYQKVNLGRDSTGRIGEVGLGGRLARLDLAVDLEGAGASSEVVGLYFGEDHQTLDYRMVINHIGRSTSSDVFLKGAVEDYAQSVFTGLLRIEKDALRSSAFETNRNLVLSENAKAHSVPNLEILCDDVVCGHGSSVGPLEEEHLYYLQSRGIPRAKAERMLVRGFFTEVIDRLPIGVVADPVQEAVFRRFVRAQEEGRLS